jgi:hypothetical protein
MIPYDELVIALATWRARQGLPMSGLSGALTPPPAVSARMAAQAAQPATRPTPRPMAAQPTPAPTPAPTPPARRTAPFAAAAAPVPPPLEPPPEDSIDRELGALGHLDEHEHLELHEHDHDHDIDQEVSEVLSETSAYPEDATFELGLAGPGGVTEDPESTSVAPMPRPDRFAATDPGRRTGPLDLDTTDEALDHLDDPDRKNW